MAKVKAKEVEYSRFTQYFIEIELHLQELNGEVEELTLLDKEIPHSLLGEIRRHSFIMTMLTQAGKELYNKEPKELRRDGWKFWFEEDMELRSTRYE